MSHSMPILSFKMASFNQMSWIFLAIVLSTDAIHEQTITSPPQHFTGIVGGTATFSCGVKFVGAQELVSWEFNNNPVYVHQFGIEDYPLGEKKYSVLKDNNTFTLIVQDLNLEDGGQYACVLLDVSETAMLLVLDTPQFLYTTPNPVEGSTTEFVCSAQFGGPSKENISPHHYPQLAMFLDGSLLKGTVTEHKLWSSSNQYNLTQIYNATLEVSMDGKDIECRIETLRPTTSKIARALVKVLYSVRNITYTPNNTHYEVGSTINCSADGNPPPQFLWQDTNKKTHIQGPSLLISEQMTGNNTWKCTAYNIVNGRTYEDGVVAGFKVVLPVDTHEISTLKPGNDIWKIYLGVTLGVTIPICLLVTGLVARYCHVRCKKTQYALVANADEISLKNVEGTAAEADDIISWKEPIWIDPSDDSNHEIHLDHVVLQVWSKSISQPVMMSVRETDVTQLRQQQMKSLGPCHFLKSAIQLNLKPTGLKLSNPAYIGIRNQEWTDTAALLVFRKEDKWTDVTDECHIIYSEEEIAFFDISKFAEMELLLCSSTSVAEPVSEMAIGILDRPVQAKSPGDHSDLDPVHQGSHPIEEETSTNRDAEKSGKDRDKKWKMLVKIMNGLMYGKDLNGPTATKMEKLFYELDGNISPEEPSALIQLIKKAEILIQSEHFVGVIEAAQSCSNIWETVREDPLLCLVELLEKDGMSPLTQHPEKLLEVIKILLQSHGSTDSRTRCFRVLITNTTEWRQYYGKKSTETDKANCAKGLLCNSGLLEVLKSLIENGADPAWSPQGSSEGSNLHLFVKVVNHVITYKSYLFRYVVHVFDVMMIESSLSCKNVDGEGMTILHALVDGRTSPLFTSSFDQLLEIISQVRIANPKLLDACNHLRHTPLQTFVTSVLAVSSNDITDVCVRVVKCLASPSNRDIQSKAGKTPLHYFFECALEYRFYPETFLKVAKHLKSAKNIDLQDENEETPLHMITAAAADWSKNSGTFLEVVKSLVSDFNIDLLNRSKDTPLMKFIDAAGDWTDHPHAFLDVVRTLRSPSNINYEDEQGFTPLHKVTCAASKWAEYPDIFLRVIESLTSEINIDLCKNNGYTPLTIFTAAAASWKDCSDLFLEVVKLLRSSGNVDFRDKEGFTPLHRLTDAAGAWKDNPDTFLEGLKCLKSDFNTDLLNEKITPLLNFTISAVGKWKECPNSFLEVVKFLRSSSNVDFQDEKGFVPLHKVTQAAGVWKDNPETFLEVIKCLKSDSNIDAYTSSKRTPLLHFTIAAAAKWKDCPESFLEVEKNFSDLFSI